MKKNIEPLEWKAPEYTIQDADVRDILITMLASIMDSKQLDRVTKRAMYTAMRAIELSNSKEN